MLYFEGTRKPDFRNISNINYDEYWRARGFNISGKLKEREVIVRGLIKKNSKILDVGCGNSLLPLKLKEDGHNVSVADISSVVLKGYSENGISALELDLDKVSLFNSNESFDYIILSEVLEHTKNPEEIISTLKKYTERFIITIPNSAFYRYRFHLMFTGRFFTQWVMHPSEHIRFWSHIDFLDWLDALNLNVEKTYASNGFSLFGLTPWLKNIWKNLFAHQIVYLCKVKQYFI
jgi:methionine biosynthesis protein MetW